VPLEKKPINNKDEIDNRITFLTQLVNTATDKFVPLTKINSKKLPDNIIQCIKIRNFYKNQRRKYPKIFSNTLINRATKDIHSKIQEFLQDNFRKKLSNVEPDKSNIHKAIRWLKPSSKANISLADSDGAIIDPGLIANKIADYYEKIYEGENLVDKGDIDFAVNEFVSANTALPNNINNLNNWITNIPEVMHIIRGLKNRKSAGIDGVSNRSIKNLPSSGLFQLVAIINAIITLQYFPNNWKISKVIPIPKAGKIGSPENTRPISLLSGLSKITERIIFRL